ncbi:glutamine--fructose-6-phosphate transaminase (isomerizing) [Oscillatoria laete-virens NRMC-F 0139]|nr:glutamine--fructose-6-phosphate transaminase (isomerizing) [Oscillatoria laete-virens]MDL5055365.1 glutamine--fructose-6-phosphate transaminase (isomerizing) [Oscillatoria laete-virens NRMC-F 0139]
MPRHNHRRARGSPLIVGVGKGENFISSDAAALASHTQTVVYLQDFDLATITREGYDIESLRSGPTRRDTAQIEYSADAAEKGDYAHHMLKEIFEQPRTIENALRGRLNRDEATAVFGGLNLSAGELRGVNRIILCACGTSWHAALLGEYLFEQFAGIPVEVEYSSEFRYRNSPIEPGTLVFVLSQSGETADTLAALRESKRKGHKTLAIVNVVGSTIAREADGGIYMHAGPEVGVAATKSFTSQTVILACLALLMGRLRHLSFTAGRKIVTALEEFPALVERALGGNEAIRGIAAQIAPAKSVFFLGRQFHFPIALEGALKLKEISYIHAEGYPSGEIKHGPIALIEPDVPTVLLCTRDDVYDKNVSALEEIKARGGRVIAIGHEGDELLPRKADAFIPVPVTKYYLQPILNMVSLQLLSYHTAVARGCDVDKPRNLAKSVTVE